MNFKVRILFDVVLFYSFIFIFILILDMRDFFMADIKRSFFLSLPIGTTVVFSIFLS